MWPPIRIQRSGHQTGEDYFWDLRSNRICPQVFDLLGIHHPFLLSLLFGRRMSILCLSHHHTLEGHNLSGFTGSQWERGILPQDESYVTSHHIWFRWYLGETSDCRIWSQCWNELRLWGLLGWNKYVFHVITMWLWGYQGKNAMHWIVSPKLICWSQQCDYIWR